MAATNVAEQFELMQVIHQGEDASIVRARRATDGRPVLLEIPRPSGVRTVDRLRHELEVGSMLDSAATLHPVGLGTFAQGPVLVFDDFSGTPLVELIDTSMDIGAVLQIATALVASLETVHRSGIVHRNINPQNIFFDLATGVAKLAGFGIASSVRGEHWAFHDQMETSLPYMSPEQTARFARPIDARSDLYSVGVILYEMLMGSRPFEAHDVMGWIYCHVARLPMPPAVITARVPLPLSDIVMKLVAKLPEDRYQTSAGLLVDLRRCVDEWTTHHSVAPFVLGSADASEQLHIPRKLYGRLAETELLTRLLQRVSTHGEPELVLVTGPAGVGKSSLARSIEATVVRSGGMFAAGTYEANELPAPYSAIAHAFREIVSHLLSEGADGVADWRRRLLDALGPLAQLIIDLVPSLETIIGKQGPVPPLPVAEAQRRFFLVARRFVSALTSTERLTLLFVDDLERADAASLALIEHLVSHPQIGKLLVIGTYRGDVPDDHPLRACMRRLRGQQISVEEVVLAPLGLVDISQLCADALGMAMTDVASLARLVWERTGGNPLSVKQLLEELDREQVLLFDATSRVWHWDLARVGGIAIPENVVDRRPARLRALSPAVRDVLELCACLEREFDARTLTSLVDDAEAVLAQAVEAGMLCAIGSSYRFVHNRIREAVYDGIPVPTRTAMHLRIGRTLLAELAPAEVSDRIFEVAGQLNRGLPLLSEPAERRRVAELDLRAGQVAAATSSFGAAATYVTAGLELVGPSPKYDALAVALQLELARCEVAQGRFAAAGDLLVSLHERAQNATELRFIERLEIDTNVAQGALGTALGVAVESLARVGIPLSRHPSSDELVTAMQDVMEALGDRSIEALEELPILNVPELESALELLGAVLPVAYLTDPDLRALIACRGAELAIRHGIAAASTLALAAFALELDWRFHRVSDARRFAEVSRRICETHAHLAYEGRTLLTLGVLATHTGPLGVALDLERQARTSALAMGDLAYAGFAGTLIVSIRIARSDPLDDVVRELRELQGEANVEMTATIQHIEGAFIANMQGRTVTSRTFTCSEFDEQQFLSTVAVVPIVAASFHLRKLQAACILGELAQALEHAQLLRPLLGAIYGRVQLADYHYYAALTHAALASSGTSDERATHVLAVAEHEQALDDWADGSPESFGHRRMLVAAEHARLTGHTREAIQLFEQAIHAAHDNGRVEGEALANERAGAYYGELGLTIAAAHCLTEARRCFAQWNARAKVSALDKSELRVGRVPVRDESLRSAPLEILQSISSEMNRAKLLITLLDVLREQSGARRAVFISVAGERWTAEATAGTNTAVPASIVDHVLHSRRYVLLHDATMPGPYSADPYIERSPPRALLCMPVARHGELIGIVYLENDLVPGLFTSERVSMLEVLVEQAAISLENARLYADRGRQIAERQQAEATLRSILDNMVDGVYVIDRFARLTFTNRAGAQLAGIESEADRPNALDLAGKVQFAHPDGSLLKVDEVPILRALAGEIVSSVDVTARDLGHGRITHLRISAAPIQDEKGAIAGAVAVAINVTRETELERLKEQFLHAVAHELKTPITVVKGYADLLRTMQPGVDAPQQPLLDALVSGADRVDRLVTDLLISWKLQRDDLELAIEDKVDLVDLVELGVVRLAPATPRRVSVQAQRPVIAAVDRELLGKVVTNLLDNAVRFSPPETPIDVQVGLDNDRAFLSVTDHGIGIPAGDRAHIFEPFFRAHADTPHDAGGIGLGLYIAKAIVLLHDGTIDVESEEGHGATFRLTVPVRRRGP